MAGRRRGARGRRSAPSSHAAAARTARVGELIRRIVASELESIDDERLDMVSITSVDVDRALQRAIVWFTALDGDNEPAAAEAFDEHAGVLRKAVGSQARLRHTPRLEFRPDTVLRSAERIEGILRDDRDSGHVFNGGGSGPGDGS
ncbi:MAG: 30S ribosome-binding factor RbfA [Acidimicrobiaceae bacterium]|nr:30S ribosome-binding factor RbfA [Acidimicrobiaceae bacterium]MDE0607732.1 30S ribosome-binding factor RbfA [Acidimicrobiaceae bacterium]